MYARLIYIFCCFLSGFSIHGQMVEENPLSRLNYFIGTWEHFNVTDTVTHTYHKVLDGNYIKLETSASFHPEDGKTSFHYDEGFFSWDESREVIVFRQFHSEGFVNTYVLIEEQSSDNYIVFETEHVENGYGLMAKLSIEIITDNEYKMTLYLGKEKGQLEACQWIHAKRNI